MSSLRKFLDASTWVVFFAAVIFSFMTVVAQNALPGDPLYGFKLGYEKVMIASSRALNKQVDLQIDFVARRFDESTKVLASKHGGESLNRLNAEVESTAYTITMIEDPAEKKAAAKKYIAQLNVISSGLGQQKINLAKNPPSNATYVAKNNNQGSPSQYTNTNNNGGGAYNPPAYQPTRAPSSNNSGSNIYPTAVPTSVPTQEPEIIGAIDDTQQTIEDTIEEMEEIAQDTTPPPTPTDTPMPPTSTPIPPTPTTEPTAIPTEPPPTPTLTLEEKLRLFCQEHPQQCNNDNNNNSNNNNNNGIVNDD
jgi:hypothetical protein